MKVLSKDAVTRAEVEKLASEVDAKQSRNIWQLRIAVGVLSVIVLVDLAVRLLT
jgi:hypothetical protein